MMQSDGMHLDLASWYKAQAVMAAWVKGGLCCIRVYDTLSYVCWLHVFESVLQGTIYWSISQQQKVANTLHYFQNCAQYQIW